MKISKNLQSVCGYNGNTKRLRTLKQAKAVLDEGWAEIFPDGEWGIAEADGHRDATKAETKLLNKVNNKNE